MPAEPYAYAEWRRCRAGLDYHVEVYGHFYSVPYRGRGRVARPFGSALTDPGRRLSRTRLFPEVTRIMPHVVSMGG